VPTEGVSDLAGSANAECSSIVGCLVSGRSEVVVAVLKALGFLIVVGASAGATVAFGRWRTSFRNRLVNGS
jgi:hypothetical protein